MEQAFARESRPLRKIKFGKHITLKIKRIISINYLLKWKESSRSKLEARVGLKPRW